MVFCKKEGEKARCKSCQRGYFSDREAKTYETVKCRPHRLCRLGNSKCCSSYSLALFFLIEVCVYISLKSISG